MSMVALTVVEKTAKAPFSLRFIHLFQLSEAVHKMTVVLEELSHERADAFLFRLFTVLTSDHIDSPAAAVLALRQTT